MSAGLKKNKGGLVEMYQANLERRIQQGDWNLVCKDEDLCKEVGDLLFNGAAQDTHSPLGLDPLSVMETSLQTLPFPSGRTGLERLAKAFEVLELAALNLYLCPWRKEYKVVKMFSGMFTHCVKPALTSQQANELFGLLGYQPTGIGEEEELRLRSKPVHANSLLQLACAFFTARVECQLLLSHMGSCAGWELQLVQERKRGHSLQIAWDSAKRKLVSTPQSSEHDMTDLDLYTDDHLDPVEKTETSMAAPPNCSYTPPKETRLTHRVSHSNTTLSKGENDESSRKAQTVCVTTMTYQINPNPYLTSTSNAELSPKSLKTFDYEKQVTLGGGSQISYKEKGHDLGQTQQNRMDVPSQTPRSQIQGWEKKTKDELKKHSCMDKSIANVFCVCHDCHNIHDFQCNDLQLCEGLKHNLQTTGMIQPPQEERGVTAPPQRHTCLREEDPPYVICYTCNKSHDCLCKEPNRCEDFAHVVKYLVEMNKEETYTKPMDLHQCCNIAQPKFVCFTCKAFHSVHCNEAQCFGKHEVEKLKSVCTVCSHTALHSLCRYCCAQYCKSCWFENPMQCKCGKALYDHSSYV